MSIGKITVIVSGVSGVKTATRARDLRKTRREAGRAEVAAGRVGSALRTGVLELVGLHVREISVQHGVLGFFDRRVGVVDRERGVVVGLLGGACRADLASWTAFLSSMCLRTSLRCLSHDLRTLSHQSEISPLPLSAEARNESACDCADSLCVLHVLLEIGLGLRLGRRRCLPGPSLVPTSAVSWSDRAI